MRSCYESFGTYRGMKAIAGLVLLAGLVPVGRAAGQEALPDAAGAAVEVQLIDDSRLKLHMLDEQLEVQTEFGKLVVPVPSVKRITFATRVPPEVAARIQEAVQALGSPEFRERQQADETLFKLGERAYPAIVQAAKSGNLDVRKRAEALVAKFIETFPKERLQVAPHDVVETGESRFSGRIVGEALRVETSAFGRQALRLSEIRVLATDLGDAGRKSALPDLVNLVQLQHDVGRTFTFQVTGAANGSVWGTDIYTTDSSLATAAVHAGVLKPGETGWVQVTIVAPPPGFHGTTRHGVTSRDYAEYPGAYTISGR